MNFAWNGEKMKFARRCFCFLFYGAYLILESMVSDFEGLKKEEYIILHRIYLIVPAVLLINELCVLLLYFEQKTDMVNNFISNLFCREENFANKSIFECLIKFFGLILLSFLIAFYCVAFIILTLLRLIDIRQLFWKNTNYIVKNLLKFIFSLCLLLFLMSINIATLIEKDNLELEKTDVDLQIVVLSFTIALIIATWTHYIYFELFVPNGLDEAQKEIAEQNGQVIKDLPGLKKYMILSKSSYMFMPEFARFMRLSQLGSMRCIANKLCTSIDLEHIFYCHSALNIPNKKFGCCYKCTGREGYFVGFHQTSYKSALKISLSPMRKTNASETEYILRVGQDGGMDALVIALVDMGRMKIVKHMIEAESKRVGGKGRLQNYDSVYALGQGKNRPDGCVTNDEFLVYEATSIKQFVVCV